MDSQASPEPHMSGFKEIKLTWQGEGVGNRDISEIIFNGRKIYDRKGDFSAFKKTPLTAKENDKKRDNPRHIRCLDLVKAVCKEALSQGAGLDIRGRSLTFKYNANQFYIDDTEVTKSQNKALFSACRKCKRAFESGFRSRLSFGGSVITQIERGNIAKRVDEGGKIDINGKYSKKQRDLLGHYVDIGRVELEKGQNSTKLWQKIIDGTEQGVNFSGAGADGASFSFMPSWLEKGINVLKGPSYIAYHGANLFKQRIKILVAAEENCVIKKTFLKSLTPFIELINLVGGIKNKKVRTVSVIALSIGAVALLPVVLTTALLVFAVSLLYCAVRYGIIGAVKKFGLLNILNTLIRIVGITSGIIILISTIAGFFASGVGIASILSTIVYVYVLANISAFLNSIDGVCKYIEGRKFRKKFHEVCNIFYGGLNSDLKEEEKALGVLRFLYDQFYIDVEKETEKITEKVKAGLDKKGIKDKDERKRILEKRIEKRLKRMFRRKMERLSRIFGDDVTKEVIEKTMTFMDNIDKKNYCGLENNRKFIDGMKGLIENIDKESHGNLTENLLYGFIFILMLTLGNILLLAPQNLQSFFWSTIVGLFFIGMGISHIRDKVIKALAYKASFYFNMGHIFKSLNEKLEEIKRKLEEEESKRAEDESDGEVESSEVVQ